MQTSPISFVARVRVRVRVRVSTRATKEIGDVCKRNAKPTLIGAVDGGTGTIGSHVAKLILYTSLSLVCISNTNQSTGSPSALFVGSGFRGHLVGIY